MKKWNKLLAVFIAMAMMLALALPMSFAKGTSGSSESPNGLKVMSMSDTHMIPESMIAGTEDYQHAINMDQKVFNESEAVLDAQLDIVREKQPDVLLLNGDLTKDGEYKAHKLMVKKLKQLKKDLPDLKIYVTNGNHDINNSDAQEFNTKDGKAVSAKKTTPEDFRTLYDGITYSDETVVETYGLSYVARPKKGFTVIVMDSNCYTAETNSDGEEEHETRGAIQDDLMAWALKQTKKAVKRGDTVIGMMHHGVVAHFSQEQTVLGSFLVDDYQNVSTKLADAGMHYVFTGHFHSQDVSVMTTEKGNTLYDIETGSSITYPCPMRATWFLREGKDDSDNGVKETVKGTTIQNLSIAHTDPQTGEYVSISDMTAFAKTKGINADVMITVLEDRLGKALGSNYPEAIDTVLETLIPHLTDMPLPEGSSHTLMDVIDYAHKTHLAGLDNGKNPQWFTDAIEYIDSGKFLAALSDVLSRDLAALTGQGVNKLTKTELVNGKAVDLLYHALFGAAHVPYYTVPQLAEQLNEFLVVTLNSLTNDTNFADDRTFTLTDANVLKTTGADWSSIDSGISEDNVFQMLIGALLGNG